MGLRGKSCHCPPQLGHRVIELPALLARGTPAFSPESELAIAAGYGCPKSESLKRLSWASVWKIVVCLLGPDIHLQWWDGSKLTAVMSKVGTRLRLSIMEGLEFSIQGLGEKVMESDKTLVREIKIAF